MLWLYFGFKYIFEMIATIALLHALILFPSCSDVHIATNIFSSFTFQMFVRRALQQQITRKSKQIQRKQVKVEIERDFVLFSK